MVDATSLSRLGNAAIVAPAGHGKTELIAQLAALGRRALILTHTHAGVHAIRARLKKLRVPTASAAVDTLAGWSTRYSHSFPGVAQPPPDPPQGQEWDQLYRGATKALSVPAIRDVVAASYDRILVDEYQDCSQLQHNLAAALSRIVPTIIFGDPMQGIFEFAGAHLSWWNTIYPTFAMAGTLPNPHRWAGKNPALGKWVAEVREQLLRGDPIDLSGGAASYRKTDTAFDMGAFFDHLDGKEGSVAAIHCNKGLCLKLAQATKGGYQAIEENEARRLQAFAVAWDTAADGDGRYAAVQSLAHECFHRSIAIAGEIVDPDTTALEEVMASLATAMNNGTGLEGAAQFLLVSRKHSRWRLFRSELWRDAERTVAEVAAGRCEHMVEAAKRVRKRSSIVGRKLPTRTVSTPLLLKGLEFEHVVIPDATHFAGESRAQAKLFYVAISRATTSLAIASSQRFLQFPRPEQ